MRFAKDVAASFGGIERLGGTFLSAIALLSWMMKVVPMHWSEVATQVVETYRLIVYPVMNLLFGWLPFDLPDWWNDGAALYFVVGGAVARTLWVFYKNHSEEKGEPYGPVLVGKFQNRFAQVAAVILSVPLWPLSLLAILAAPYVMRNPRNANVFSGSYARYKRWMDDGRSFDYVCNLRTVFFLQVVAVVALCTGAVLWEL